MDRDVIFAIASFAEPTRLKLALSTAFKTGALVFAFVCLTPLAKAQTGDVTLTLDPVNKQNITVTFLPAVGVAADKPADTELRDMVEALTAKHKFQVYADLTHVGPNKYANLILYTFYVHDHSATGEGSWFRFEVKSQTGNFVDCLETVHFTVSRAHESDDGEIALPLHSFGDQPLVNITLAENPAKIRVSSSNNVQLNVENLSPTLGVNVLEPAQLILDNQSLWKTAAGSLNVTGAPNLAPGGRTTIFVPLAPNRMDALLATLSPFGTDKSHDTIKIVLNWTADQGGAVKPTSPISIPIRFEPSLPSLFLALTLGSVIATLLGQLLPGAWKNWRVLLHQLGVSWGLAIVAELFAMLLVQLGSKFVLVGFELDPWQVLPALFIGFFASGGKHLLDYIAATKAQAPQGRTPSRPATDHAAAGGNHD